MRYIEAIGDYMWRSLSIATRSPTQDHRKSLLLYWFMSNVRKCVPYLPIAVGDIAIEITLNLI